MKKILIAAIAALSLATPSMAHEEENTVTRATSVRTVEGMVAMCTSKKVAFTLNCIGKVSGVANMLALNCMEGLDTPYKMGQYDDYEMEDGIDTFLSWAEFNPEMNDVHWTMAMAYALSLAYPCPN